jgi:hypothetical protein
MKGVDQSNSSSSSSSHSDNNSPRKKKTTKRLGRRITSTCHSKSAPQLDDYSVFVPLEVTTIDTKVNHGTGKDFLVGPRLTPQFNCISATRSSFGHPTTIERTRLCCSKNNSCIPKKPVDGNPTLNHINYTPTTKETLQDYMNHPNTSLLDIIVVPQTISSNSMITTTSTSMIHHSYHDDNHTNLVKDPCAHDTLLYGAMSCTSLRNHTTPSTTEHPLLSSLVDPLDGLIDIDPLEGLFDNEDWAPIRTPAVLSMMNDNWNDHPPNNHNNNNSHDDLITHLNEIHHPSNSIMMMDDTPLSFEDTIHPKDMIAIPPNLFQDPITSSNDASVLACGKKNMLLSYIQQKRNSLHPLDLAL